MMNSFIHVNIKSVFCKSVILPTMCSDPTRAWQHMCRYGCQVSSTLPVHIPTRHDFRHLFVCVCFLIRCCVKDLDTDIQVVLLCYLSVFLAFSPDSLHVSLRSHSLSTTYDFRVFTFVLTHL